MFALAIFDLYGVADGELPAIASAERTAIAWLTQSSRR